MRTIKKTTQSTLLGILLGLPLTFPQSAISQTVLAVKRVSASGAQVLLSNNEAVAAIQFTVVSSGPDLGTISAGSRVNSAEWQFSFHQTTSTSINVVVLRTGSANLAVGEGSIANFEITGTGVGTLSLARVVVASPSAQDIEAVVENLDWAPEDSPLAVLGQNFPNPFNPATTIPYVLEREGEVSLMVYDIAGREVRRILDGRKQAGAYTAVWNGVDERGIQVPSGTYFVRLQAGSVVQTRKMVFTK